MFMKTSDKLPMYQHMTVTLHKKPQLVITKEFQRLFEFFCQENKTVEWSGILFYNVEGSFNDIGSMVITPIDIYLMDVGTAGHTQFVTDASIVNYMMKEGLGMCGRGLIHSH